jgi:hypothetical protein
MNNFYKKMLFTFMIIPSAFEIHGWPAHPDEVLEEWKKEEAEKKQELAQAKATIEKQAQELKQAHATIQLLSAQQLAVQNTNPHSPMLLINEPRPAQPAQKSCIVM